MVYPYIEGVSLDKILHEGSYTLAEATQWSEQLIESFEIVRSIPVIDWGKGIDSESENYSEWYDFLFSYLKEQEKKGPRIADLRYERLVDTINKYQNNIKKEVNSSALVCADVNARNYLITQKRELICIHTPMMWRADPAVPFGDALVHLDNSLFGKCFKNMTRYPAYRTYLYAAFSAYVILAYVERFSTEPLEKALPWGGNRPLLDILDHYLDLLN